LSINQTWYSKTQCIFEFSTTKLIKLNYFCFYRRKKVFICRLVLLFIHKILFSSTCFEPQVPIFRRIQLYTCSIWYCHSLWEFLVACRYTAWVRTDCRGKVVGGRLRCPTNNLPPTVISHSSCIPTGHQELS